MSKRSSAPARMPAIIEYEIDPRNIFGTSSGSRRRKPRPPLSVKVYRMTPEQHEAFLRKIGIKREAADE